MSAKQIKSRSKRLGALLSERSCLELHATETRHEIQQLKTALRITQQRVRRINAQIRFEQSGRPALRLVYDASSFRRVLGATSREALQ